MATLNILTPDELANREQKPRTRGRIGRRRSAARTRIIESFKAELQDAEPGYGVDVTIGEGEDKRVVRMNLKAAADELGIALDFRPIKDKSRMHIRIVSLEEKAAMPPRGGRPRRAQADVPQETNGDAAQETGGNGAEPEATPAARTRRRRNQQQQASAE